jgi:hypothetical protein
MVIKVAKITITDPHPNSVLLKLLLDNSISDDRSIIHIPMDESYAWRRTTIKDDLRVFDDCRFIGNGITISITRNYLFHSEVITYIAFDNYYLRSTNESLNEIINKYLRHEKLADVALEGYSNLYGSEIYNHCRRYLIYGYCNIIYNDEVLITQSEYDNLSCHNRNMIVKFILDKVSICGYPSSSKVYNGVIINKIKSAKKMIAWFFTF